MSKRIGKYTVETENRPKILGSAAAVGSKESRGPLGQWFDFRSDDDTLGEKSWEKAESQLQMEALIQAVQKTGNRMQDLQYIFAGDLLNQCISSVFGLRGFNIPFLGQYGACSTMAQCLALAALFADSGAADLCAAVTSSHFCSAERQFRLPLEYGGQRTPTAQWTATASGAAIVGPSGKELPWIEHVTVGRIRDLGVKDAANMGAAMAPAAAQTLLDFFSDTKKRIADFDLIVTGDLGAVGAELFQRLLGREGVSVDGRYNDCGLMLYDRTAQDVHAGASGCGCSAAVMCSHIFARMNRKELRQVLFIGTGALMSPTSSQQGESIPGVAHAVSIRV